MSLFAQMLKGKVSGKAVSPEKPPASPAVIPEPPGRPALPVVIPESPNPPAVRAVEPPSDGKTAALRRSTVPESESFRLHRQPEDHSPEERALRDEKIEYVRAVWELHRTTGAPEGHAAAAVAQRVSDFPRLAAAGKNGSSSLCYNNYRNWVNGYGDKPGLGRLNDGTPDYRNADVLLRNYSHGETRELYGDPLFWKALRGVWLRTSDQYLAKAYRHLRWNWELDYPDQLVPRLYQVRDRFRKDYPQRMLILARKGESAYDQLIRDYIERDPDSIRPGEAWVADTKDCDFMIRVPADPEDNAGKQLKSAWKTVRPKLVVIMDVKSQFPVSVQLIDGSCGNAVIRNGFAAAVARFGRPKIFLTDNGSDYCKAGFGDPVVFTPNVNGKEFYEHSILRELDVEHDKSLPYNARAKIVERFFREVAGYERDTRGYVGNKPENRPATADVWAKIKGREYLNNTEEACRWIAELMMIYLNTPSSGAFLKGMTPIQAFRPETRYTRAPMTEEEYLRAFRLPLPEAKKLDPRGPFVRLDNQRYVVIPEDRERAWKYDNELVMVKTVLFTRDRIYIHSLDGKYIGECRRAEKLPYFHAPKELLEERQKEINAEKVMLRARIMDATGGWHLIDAQTTYQMPRSAFAAPAPVKLLDRAMSVGGESHNPAIHILKSEERPETVVCPEKTMIPESQKRKPEEPEKKKTEAEIELESLVEKAITGGFDPESDTNYTLPTIKEKNDDNSDYELPDIR